MTVRQLSIVAAVMAVLTGLGVLVVDAALARALGPDAGEGAMAEALGALVSRLDQVSGMLWPRKGLLGAALIVVGGALWWWRRDLAQPLLLLGLTHALARTLGGQLKPLTGRLRPTEALARGHVDDSFGWLDGISFPSGHVAHYAALAFAVSLAWPRARIPALGVLALVVVARVGANAHWLSDATGSLALAALAAAASQTALDRLGPPRR